MPYIIGSMTRHRFIKLEPFAEHINRLDVDGEKVLAQYDGNYDKIYGHYRTEWAAVLKNARKSMQAGIKKRSLAKSKTETKDKLGGPLYPYKPHTDLGPNHVFGEYDVLWSTSLLCKPGKQGFFLVYKFDNDRVLKAHFSANVPVRPIQNVHHHIL